MGKTSFLFRFVFSAIFIFVGLIGIFLWFFASAFMGPFPNFNQPIPQDLSVEVIDFKDEADTQLKGWFIEGNPEKGVVLLLHGHAGYKSISPGRIRFLHQAGYSVFTFDFQGHGESQPKYATVGFDEAKNVRAAIAFLKSRMPDKKIAIIGPSLGGAALLVKDQVIEADAYILEGVYYSLEKTGEHRIAELLGQELGRILAPLLIAQTQIRLGFDASALVPLETVSELKAPVLVIGGASDPFVLPEETRALFDRISSPKELWMVDGAGHFDFYLYKPEEYKNRVLSFLNTYFK